MGCSILPISGQEKYRKTDYNYTPYKDVLEFGNIQFPVQIKDIAKFEKLNVALSVCVFAYDEKNKLYNLYLSKNYGLNKIEVDLLLLLKIRMLTIYAR